MRSPLFAALAANHMGHNVPVAQVYDAIGRPELATDPIWGNTCAIRMIIALIGAGVKIRSRRLSRCALLSLPPSWCSPRLSPSSKRRAYLKDARKCKRCGIPFDPAAWCGEINCRKMSLHNIGGNMAADFYLQLDGIKCGSMDSQHQRWIELESVNWSITKPRSAISSAGGGHTAERAELSEARCMKACAMGKTIPRAKIKFWRADGTERIKYYEIELENVFISHVAPSVGEGVAPKFSKEKWKYCVQKVGGGAGGNTTGGWDLATSRVAA